MQEQIVFKGGDSQEAVKAVERYIRDLQFTPQDGIDTAERVAKFIAQYAESGESLIAIKGDERKFSALTPVLQSIQNLSANVVDLSRRYLSYQNKKADHVYPISDKRDRRCPDLCSSKLSEIRALRQEISPFAQKGKERIWGRLGGLLKKTGSSLFSEDRLISMVILGTGGAAGGWSVASLMQRDQITGAAICFAGGAISGLLSAGSFRGHRSDHS